MPPITLEITIQRRAGAEAPVVAVLRAPGALPVQRMGRLRLDDDALRDLLTLQLDPLAYGTYLGQALFQETVRDLFIQSRRATGDKRVLLVVEDPQLRALYWQRLCAPNRAGGARWDFLALDQQEPFSLYLPSQTDRRYLPFGRRDLRALVVVASPPAGNDFDLAPFAVPETVTGIVAALGNIPCDVLAQAPGAVGPPTLDELVMRLTSHPYTLLHVVAHGRFATRSGESTMFLLTADGAVDGVRAERLLQRLDRVQGVRGLPHLAFLATCQSADPRAEAVGALGGLGQRLVRDLGMPAVVAMTEQVALDTAAALATAFYTHLRLHGEVDRALAEACAGLAEHGDITVPALYSRLGGLPLFSDSLDRDLTPNEVTDGLAQLRALLPVRAPVLLTPFEAQAAHVAQLQTAGPEFLTSVGKAERVEALASLNRLTEEVLETLSFNALALGTPPPPYDDRCPFRGLQAFRSADRAFFFGREAWVTQLVARLVDHPFLAVLGPSGSGKSSLVLAGLVPAWCDRMPGCQVAVMTPGRDPLGQLAVALVSESGESRLLVVDQFEELFTLTSDETQRRLFVERLLVLAAQQPVVLTMRAEFWGDCAPYSQLREAMQAHQALVAPMTPHELRSAMEQQAAVVGLRFEADLAQTLLDDVAGEPGAMPLLQHALLELWKRRRGRWLRAAEYRALGGVSQAIAGTAEAVYTTLAPPERQQVRAIFLRLVRLDDQDAQRDTRRRVALDELVTQGSDRASVVRLVTRLADEKLLVTQTNPASGHDEVELAHEALVERWERLQAWITQDRQAIAQLQDLSRAAREWDERRRPGGLLLHDPLLHEASALQATDPAMLNLLETQFLMASRRHQRMNRIRQVALISPFVIIPLALLLAGLLRFDLGPPKESAWQRVAEWQQATAGIGQYGAFVTVDPTDSRLVYAADRSKGGVYQSTDGGRAWQKINHPLLQDSVVRSLAVAQDGTLAAATSGCAFEAGKTRPPEATGNSTVSTTTSCLFVSNDRARSWQPIPLPVQDITPGAYLFAVTVDPEDPQQLYLGLWHDGVWQTRDSGGTWQRVSSLQDLDASHLIRALAAADGKLFIATEKGLYRMPTTPTALAAPERIGPPANVTVSALAIEPQTSDLLVGTRGNGTWRVNETEWVSQSTYGDATAFTFSVGPGQDVLYVGTSDQGLLRRETRHWWQPAWWASADITQMVVTELLSGAPQGMEWVPAGEFEMGAPEAARLVYVDEFFVHANEISQEAYCAQSTCAGADATRAMYPKVDVSGRQAAKFCTDQGYRLPTEPEWEKAARGPDGRKFPWGDAEPTEQEANLYYGDTNSDPATGKSRRVTTPVAWPLNEHLAEQQRGTSPYGLRHMCGNVSEITNSAVSTKEFLVLGAGYTSPPQWSATYHREKNSALPATSSGFRCVSVPNR